MVWFGRNSEAEFKTMNQLMNYKGGYRAARAAKNGICRSGQWKCLGALRHVRKEPLMRSYISEYLCRQVGRNTARSFKQIQLIIFEKYGKRQMDPDLL